MNTCDFYCRIVAPDTAIVLTKTVALGFAPYIGLRFSDAGVEFEIEELIYDLKGHFWTCVCKEITRGSKEFALKTIDLLGRNGWSTIEIDPLELQR